MLVPRTRSSPADALNGMWTLLVTVTVIGALYLGREVLVPLALAMLLTFLLAPVVARLQRWLGRVGAVVVVVLALVAVAVGGGWVLTRQVIDLANELPNYKGNIRNKLQALKGTGEGTFSRLVDTLEELKHDLPGEPEAVAEPGEAPARVEMVAAPDASPWGKIRRYLGPVVGPLGTAGLVLLLLVFMLLKREDLRARVIRLVGQGRISATTRAMSDAGARVSRYLLMLLVVNVSYGVPVAIGLYFIGVPNAVLWGSLATILRFIPYLGPWLAASFPVLLSIAVSPDWVMPLLTLGLFVVLELISNNIMEPWLYGSSTGVAPVALIVAAVFWTWMWGPVGLALATPITVCMVVLGRHIPRMGFLSVMLSDEEALTPAEDCYHRLLRGGEHDEIDLVDTYLRSHALVDLYDEVLVPVMVAAEADYRAGVLEEDQRLLVAQGLRDLLDELAPTASGDDELAPTTARRVFLLPSRAQRDEMAAEMLAQLLGAEGAATVLGSAKLGPAQNVIAANESHPGCVCVSALAPVSVRRVRLLCQRLHEQLPGVPVVVGTWSPAETQAVPELHQPGVAAVVTTFAEALAALRTLGCLASAPKTTTAPGASP